MGEQIRDANGVTFAENAKVRIPGSDLAADQGVVTRITEPDLDAPPRVCVRFADGVEDDFPVFQRWQDDDPRCDDVEVVATLDTKDLTMPDSEKRRHLIHRYEQQVGRVATDAERAGIERAITDAAADSITARLALGTLVGVNDDWPVAILRNARRDYDLTPDLPEVRA